MSDFKGQLGLYRVVTTADNSPTLWSEFFDENCHSTHGAYAETLNNYVETCGITEHIGPGPLVILEVGFGLGMGLKATIENAKGPIHFVSLELDQQLVLWAKQNLPITGLDWSGLSPTEYGYTLKYHHHRLDILIGDARQTLPKWDGPKFHAIYQDPFSPKKNPMLWSVEWFEQLKNKSEENVIMATYSASVMIRKAMLMAGWHPHSLKGFTGKRERTIARLVGPVDEKLERRLRASEVQALRDKANSSIIDKD